MRAQDFTQQLDEASYVDPEITQILKIKGFRKLGAGVDQAAYLAPTGQAVLKIFGGGYRGNIGQITRDQRMFMVWAEYCAANAGNPFLPRFLPGEGGKPWAPFDFDGRRYLQIWQERLYPLPEEISDDISDFAYLVRKWGADDVIAAAKQGRGKFSLLTPGMRGIKDFLIPTVGRSGFELLVQTIDELAKIAFKNGYRLDLHGGNWLRRRNDDIVIVDPWVV